MRILSEDLIPRTCEQPQQLLRAAEYVSDQLKIWNPQTRYQHYNIGSNIFANIISEFGPDTKEVLIVGAHYDAFASLPGADDNASGVAGLLELGRILSKAPLTERVVLIAYACEEPPYFSSTGMGSYVHANSLEEKDVALMISLEMIGYFSNNKNSQQYPIPLLSFLYPNKGDFVAVVGNMFTLPARSLKKTINSHTDITAYSINAPASVPGVDFSDHRNYWARGYPAVMVTDTAFYRNHFYHTSKDTFDKLDYQKMAQIVLGVYMHILHIAADT